MNVIKQECYKSRREELVFSVYNCYKLSVLPVRWYNVQSGLRLVVNEYCKL